MMKSLLTVCLLGVAPAWSQDAPPDVKLESKVPSIEIAYDQQNRIVFRNTSARAVTDMTVVGTNAMGEFRNRLHPLIPPNGTFVWPAALVKSAGVGPDNTRVLTVTAALFDDRGYEGDAVAATRLAGQLMGRQAEVERISAIIASSSGDDDAAIARLEPELQINKHRYEIDPLTLERLKTDFPELMPGDPSPYREFVASGMEGTRGKVSSSLASYAGDKQRRQTTSLAKWWDLYKQSLEP